VVSGPSTALPITELLRQWRAGDQPAFDRLMPLIQNELRQRAQGLLRRERQGHTLQPTALVNEAYLRLVGGEVKVDWADRAHFFAVAARVMRQILVDHARAQSRQKRGGEAIRVTLDEAHRSEPGPDLDILALNDALTNLAKLSERKAHLIELSFFGGLTYPELAETTGVSEATVHRELRLAKAWLRRELDPASA
jgi:RNA polymerase sigma factor (TIGR02999 family)